MAKRGNNNERNDPRAAAAARMDRVTTPVDSKANEDTTLDCSGLNSRYVYGKRTTEEQNLNNAWKMSSCRVWHS